MRGVRVVTKRAGNAVAVTAVSRFQARTNAAVTDVKSRGPDTPMLVSSAMRLKRVVANGGQQARCTEEIAYKR
jgi:hypothetical protein